MLLGPGLPPTGVGAGAGVGWADVVDGAVLTWDVDGSGGGAVLTRGVVVVGRGVGVTDRVAGGELVRWWWCHHHHHPAEWVAVRVG